MKKLNRKGFTLIELLAIIVILAIILVITIPNVLSSISNARSTSFETAGKTIVTYLQEQYDMCLIGDASIATYETSLFTTGTCNFKTTTSDLKGALEKAGYSESDIVLSSISVSNNKVTITAKSVANGKFSGVSDSTAKSFS